MAASVADVAALEAQLSPALLQQHREHIQTAPIVMLDGNLSPASLLVRPLPSIPLPRLPQEALQTPRAS